VKPEELDASLKRGEISPLYYFYGDEPYLMERSIEHLLDRIVDPSGRDFNLNIFYATESRVEDIVDTAQTLPMFAEWRVVLVRRGNALSQGSLDHLLSYLQNPSPSTCLIIQGEKIDQRKRFFAEFKKNGVLVECKRPYENQLGGIVRLEAAAHGKKIDPAAAEMLVHLIGNNLQELASELEKLSIYTGQRAIIGLEDVRNVVSDTRVDSVFELVNALGERGLTTAIRRLQTILRDGEPPLMLMAMIARHFRQLWQVRELIDRKKSDSEIGREMGINPYFLKGVLKQARNFSVNDYRRLFEQFLAADVSLKSGSRPAVVLGELTMKICKG
jgi:DNA polymerase-3 subunit delta